MRPYPHDLSGAMSIGNVLKHVRTRIPCKRRKPSGESVEGKRRRLGPPARSIYYRGRCLGSMSRVWCNESRAVVLGRLDLLIHKVGATCLGRPRLRRGRPLPSPQARFSTPRMAFVYAVGPCRQHKLAVAALRHPQRKHTPCLHTVDLPISI
jgi:hypothetical protein